MRLKADVTNDALEVTPHLPQPPAFAITPSVRKTYFGLDTFQPRRRFLLPDA
jgi:hypothetical protein